MALATLLPQAQQPSRRRRPPPLRPRRWGCGWLPRSDLCITVATALRSPVVPCRRCVCSTLSPHRLRHRCGTSRAASEAGAPMLCHRLIGLPIRLLWLASCRPWATQQRSFVDASEESSPPVGASPSHLPRRPGSSTWQHPATTSS